MYNHLKTQYYDNSQFIEGNQGMVGKVIRNTI